MKRGILLPAARRSPPEREPCPGDFARQTGRGDQRQPSSGPRPLLPSYRAADLPAVRREDAVRGTPRPPEPPCPALLARLPAQRPLAGGARRSPRGPSKSRRPGCRYRRSKRNAGARAAKWPCHTSYKSARASGGIRSRLPDCAPRAPSGPAAIQNRNPRATSAESKNSPSLVGETRWATFSAGYS